MSSNTIYDYVERISELLKIDSRQVGAEHQLLPVQVEVLHYLSVCNRYSDTPMAVAEYLGQTKGTVSQTLKVLEKKDLIIKKVDQADKRIFHLKLSTKGKRVIKQLVPTPLFIKVSDILSEKEQSEIENALKRLLITLLKANNLKTFGVCSSCRYNSKSEGDKYFCELVQQPLTSDDVLLICREHTD